MHRPARLPPMLHTFAVANYRSLRDLKLKLEPLTLVTGANGSGKSNLYRALRLLQQAAAGRLAEALAAEGGIPSVQWAGPADTRSQQKRGLPIQGTRGKDVLRISFGFAADDVAYAIKLGLPAGGNPVARSRFRLDPEVKSECIWQAPPQRRANTWLEREGPLVNLRNADGEWQRLGTPLAASRSVLSELSEPQRFPEVFALRERLRSWRFYDGFRTDADSPLRQPRVSVQTGALAHDGHDLAAALQTIIEIGDADALHAAVDDAFPGSRIAILGDDARLEVGLNVDGLLRELRATELSDGTLRYLCLLAALQSPRPPELLVLNEPEQSLHPDLLRPLARQIVRAAGNGQVWVISHAPALIAAIEDQAGIVACTLMREYGETRIAGQGLLDEPLWP
ncbi:AAA family ATPase [Tahibacter harae]|uniref:AAA family ATPase n=1 Tax=Tahibacter harae TaxID=2963937 RepID=A0ABT1QY27_9GAMM|nr:AAA family ATPase [Tahibacter harae]MCQ4167191.1 AAA family ATPase [Tahibacter harae]